MNEPREPVRWSEASSDDAPPELTRLLQNARADLPGSRELAALGIALPAGLAGSSGAGLASSGKTAAGTVAKAGSLTAASKVAVTAVIAVAAGASLYLARSGEPVPAPPSEASVLATPQAVAADDVVGDAPVTAASVPPDAPSTDSQDSTERTVPAVRSSEELPLLQRARRALFKDPDGALALVRRHERDFPRGKYVQEREVIRIEALRRLGKKEEAERLGAEFNQRFPGSAHKSKLDRDGQ